MMAAVSAIERGRVPSAASRHTFPVREAVNGLGPCGPGPTDLCAVFEYAKEAEAQGNGNHIVSIDFGPDDNDNNIPDMCEDPPPNGPGPVPTLSPISLLFLGSLLLAGLWGGLRRLASAGPA